MTLFEYMSVGVVIVLSFGVVRILDGAPSAFHREKRYWPHCLWVAIKFLNHFQFFWMLWGTRDGHWTFVAFLAQLSIPVVLYLQASALVSSLPNSIEDWRAHFYSVRRRFFALNMVFGILNGGVFALPTGGSPPLPVLAVCLSVVALSAIAFRWDSHRVQSTIVLLLALLNVVVIAGLIMAPPQFVDAV